MSFMLTTEQVRSRTKTVTRRLGWKTAKAGDVVQPVVKGQGLKNGERIEKIGGPIRFVNVRAESLRALLTDVDYGIDDVRREGFGQHPAVWGSPTAFVEYFLNAQPAKHRPSIDDTVTRIEFEYLDA